jgi:hypothetical protein
VDQMLAPDGQGQTGHTRVRRRFEHHRIGLRERADVVSSGSVSMVQPGVSRITSPCLSSVGNVDCVTSPLGHFHQPVSAVMACPQWMSKQKSPAPEFHPRLTWSHFSYFFASPPTGRIVDVQSMRVHSGAARHSIRAWVSGVPNRQGEAQTRRHSPSLRRSAHRRWLALAGMMRTITGKKKMALDQL